MPAAFHSFDGAEAWAEATATRLAAALRAAVDARGAATFAASGGTSPGPILERLAAEPLDWPKITLTVTDDRRVAEDHRARNLALLKRCMAKAADAGARVLALEAAPADLRVDAVLLGFGNDQHVASIFPAGEGMDAARAADAPPVVFTTPEPLPPEAPFPRVTLSMRALSGADVIVVAAVGDAKRATYESARDAEPARSPLAHVLAQDTPPIHVMWRP